MKEKDCLGGIAPKKLPMHLENLKILVIMFVDLVFQKFNILVCTCIIWLAVFKCVFGSYNFLFLSRWIPEEDAERSKENIHDPDDGHQPGEADTLGDDSSDRRTCGSRGRITRRFSLV